MKPERMTILMCDDDPDDRFLAREAFEEAGTQDALEFACDGVELLERLRDEGKPRPHLILLDLNMPRMNGQEALAEIKADDRLKAIPVVAFTTSSADQDIAQTYSRGVAGYIVKPLTYEGVVDVARKLDLYWQKTVEHPRGKDDRAA